jgi:hypothetical protein
MKSKNYSAIIVPFHAIFRSCDSSKNCNTIKINLLHVSFFFFLFWRQPTSVTCVRVYALCLVHWLPHGRRFLSVKLRFTYSARRVETHQIDGAGRKTSPENYLIVCIYMYKLRRQWTKRKMCHKLLQFNSP